MTTITARLRAVEPLNATVKQLLLDATGFEFSAGQYIYLHAGQQRLPLSVASAPARLPELELHYRSTPGDPDAAALDALLLHAHELTLAGPHGDVVVTGPTGEPLTLIAGGTGSPRPPASSSSWRTAKRSSWQYNCGGVFRRRPRATL